MNGNNRPFQFDKLDGMKWVRHILFWAVYCTFFYFQSISPQSLQEFTAPATYRNAFFSLVSFIPVCVLYVYVSLYVIFPRFLENKLYLRAALSFILLFAIGTTLNYFAAALYYSLAHLTGKGPLLLGYLNTLWAMIISGIAIGLKAVRQYQKEQKEINELLRNKTRNELNLTKRKMQPEFLYSTLDRIHTGLVSNDPSSSAMILTLSNVLSYSLYGTDAELISLEDELLAVEDIITLQIHAGRTIELNVDDVIDKPEVLVQPMSIFSIVQNLFFSIKDLDGMITIEVAQPDDMILVEIDVCETGSATPTHEPVRARIPAVYSYDHSYMAHDPA